jgi:hypothetical protein
MPDFRQLRRPKASKAPAHPSLPHKWVWHATRWICSQCGRTARRRTPALLRSPCSGTPRTTELHASHTAFRGFIGSLPIVFCWHCGAYSSSRQGKLQKQCRPQTSTIVTRLRRGVHPATNRSIQNVTLVQAVLRSVTSIGEAASLYSTRPPDPSQRHDGEARSQATPSPSAAAVWEEADLAQAEEALAQDELEHEWQAAFEAACQMGATGCL